MQKQKKKKIKKNGATSQILARWVDKNVETMEVKKKKKNWAGRRDEINGEEKKKRR